MVGETEFALNLPSSLGLGLCPCHRVLMLFLGSSATAIAERWDLCAGCTAMQAADGKIVGAGLNAGSLDL